MVVDDDINVRAWADVIWVITTRGETSRDWGRTMQMTPEVTARMAAVWQCLGL